MRYQHHRPSSELGLAFQKKGDSNDAIVDYRRVLNEKSGPDDDPQTIHVLVSVGVVVPRVETVCAQSEKTKAAR